MLSENAQLIVQLSAYIVLLEQEVTTLRGSLSTAQSRINELATQISRGMEPQDGEVNGSHQS